MPGVPPKEMEDYNDYEEQQGYFARLEKAKTLRHASLGSSPPSGPTGLPRANTMLERTRTERPGSLRMVLSRQASLPADFRVDDRQHPEPTSPLSPGGSSLSSSLPGTPLTPSGPMAGGGGGGRLDAYRAARSKDSRRAAKYSWWDKMGSSALNEKPDEQEDKSRAYVPQYDVTGQGLHYRMPEDKEEVNPVVQATA